VKLRLEPSPAPIELLRGYCGTARAAFNTLLYRVRADLGQRAAEKTYDITYADLTPAVSWHRFGLEKPLRENRENREQWHADVPYLVLDRSAHHLVARFGRSVGDNGFGQLVEVAARQAGKRGCAVVQADRFYPWSKTCSHCRAVKAAAPVRARVHLHHLRSESGPGFERGPQPGRASPHCQVRRPARSGRAVSCWSGVSDAGEAGSRQTPTPSGDGAAAFQALGPGEATRPLPQSRLGGSGSGEPVPTDRGSGASCVT
jgi:hypothetical protein